MAKIVNWDKYKNAIDDFAEQANQDTILWYRSLGGIDRFSEDNPTERFSQIELPVLIQYNYFRSWPITKDTETGALDNESCMAYFNKEQLDILGYINTDGYFDFNPTADYWILHGKKYKAKGDTDAAQGGTNPLYCLVILQRDKLPT